jgi:hypothetical protein
LSSRRHLARKGLGSSSRAPRMRPSATCRSTST